MNKLITSTLLTLSAVPFLMAAPAASTVQNQATTTQTKAAKKTHKSHAKKSSKTTGTDAAAPSSAQPKQ